VARFFRLIGRWLMLVLLAGLALEVFFVLRIAMMVAVDPGSSAFMRSESWRVLREGVTSDKPLHWSATWVPYEQISPNLKRAVMASEDAGFLNHNGVEWEAIQAAWDKNARRQAIAERKAEQLAAKKKPVDTPATRVKLVGGSTITQQLAKNLLLSGERSFLRKGQELLLAMTLELFLDKRRILEIYLNSVEWGDGVFGAEAAAQRYFKVPASKLSPYQAAQLAVMLPAPKRYELRMGSAYLTGRARTIQGRMGDVTAP